MPTEETLEAAADEILRAHCGKPLTDIQRMILRESLAGKVYEQMEGYTTQHIKNEGKDLWKLLSETLGEKVSKTNFKGALENWQKAREVAKMPPDPRAYEPDTWVGRSTIIDELLPKLQNKTRLVWITGISGIGKTTLGECLACRAWKTNPTFQWEHLEVSESQGADFTTIAADLLAKLGDRDLDPQERNDPKRLTDRLIRKLQSSCYWVQLDSLEWLLNTEQGTEFADAHWVTFLRRCLTERDFASRLVLTAQALPSALVEFANRYPNVWEAKTLAGLSANKLQNEHLEFFSKHGVVVDEENQAILSKLGQVYEGHTLVLRVMSGEIQADFAGDAGQYWAVNQQEFEQVARSLADKRLNATEYNDALDQQVRGRVKKSLQQLPPDAQDLLLRSSVYRRPVPKQFWLGLIEDRSLSQQQEAYQVLCDRALVEKESTDIRQHNLIRAIAYDLVKADRPNWHSAERKSAHLWLTAYKPVPDASNLEIVRGYLEAFDHYCEVGDWDAASAIYTYELAGTNQELYLQLFIGGYYRGLIEMSRRLIDQVTYIMKKRCLSQISNCYTSLGKIKETIDYCQQLLWLTRKNGDWAGVGQAMLKLGLAYRDIGQYGQAIDCYQKSLTIARQMSARDGEGFILDLLGITYRDIGQYKKAIEYHKESLAIARELSDLPNESDGLGCLGLAYDSLGQYARAIICHQKSLTVARAIPDRRREGNALAHLGLAYESWGKYECAIDYHQQSLKIARVIGDRRGESHALGRLGFAYESWEKYERSIDYHQQSLKIARILGIRYDEGHALRNLGATQLKLRQYPESLNHTQQALDIFREIGARDGEAEALKNLAELHHQALGEVEVARQYCQQSLELATELGIPLEEECQKLKKELEERGASEGK
jgi:tetratricopeptide (TPR) repeat protein